MTNKQAAETLRKAAKGFLEFRDIDIPIVDVAASANRGADAIEMLEWLQRDDCLKIHATDLWYSWDGKGTFRDFCEAKWRESRGE